MNNNYLQYRNTTIIESGFDDFFGLIFAAIDTKDIRHQEALSIITKINAVRNMASPTSTLAEINKFSETQPSLVASVLKRLL